MKFQMLSILMIIACCYQATAKIYTKCELARRLDGIFPRSQLPNWVCLVKFESNFNSKAKGPRNSNGSYDWGIFQINDKYWCKPGQKGGDCNIDCNRFLLDDITDDIKCAQKIYGRHGYNAWYGWKNHCQGSLASYSVKECF